MGWWWCFEKLGGLQLVGKLTYELSTIFSFSVNFGGERRGGLSSFRLVEFRGLRVD